MSGMRISIKTLVYISREIPLTNPKGQVRVEANDMRDSLH